MKLLSYTIFFISLAVALGCQQQAANVAAPPATPAEPDTDVVVVVDEGAEAEEFVIDVRSKEEWDTGHLEQAVLIPHTEITDRIAEVTENKSAKIVLY